MVSGIAAKTALVPGFLLKKTSLVPVAQDNRPGVTLLGQHNRLVFLPQKATCGKYIEKTV